MSKARFFKNFFQGFFKPRSYIPLIIPLTFTYQKMVSCQVAQKFDELFNDSYQNHKNESELKKKTMLISGNGNTDLAEQISKILGIPLADAKITQFNDGESNISIQESVRGRDVYIIQSISAPVNDRIMELLLMISAARRASASRINIIVPYYGYCRQDRKTQPRVPISAADIARLYESVGADRLIAVDLHSGQIQGFFSPRFPVDNLEANVVALNYFVNQKDINLDQPCVVVSPDAGGVTRVKNFADLLRKEGHNCDVAMIIKERKEAGKIAQMNLVGNVANKHAIIIDDIIDTAGTLCEGASKLKENGATSVTAFATHGLFSGPALKRLGDNSALQKVIVTNSLPMKDGEQQVDKIMRLSVAPLLAETIYRIQMNQSITKLFSPNIKRENK